MTEAFLNQKELAARYGLTVATVKKWRERTRKGDPFGPPLTDEKTLFQPTALRIKYRLADVLAWEQALGIHPLT